MSTFTSTKYSCDFCNYGGELTRPEDFRHFASGVDLCKWCSAAEPLRALECGRHLITFTSDSWSRSCGEVYRRPLFVPARVVEALPNMLRATATIHSEAS